MKINCVIFAIRMISFMTNPHRYPIKRQPKDTRLSIC